MSTGHLRRGVSVRSILAMLGSIAFAIVGADARADPCPGASPFGDVPASASYCTNAEWLANRSITLGCGAGQFCPNDPVTRAQMALFMNRLAVALTPVTLTATQSRLAGSFSPNEILCQTATAAAAGHPRIAHAMSTVNLDQPSTGIDIRAQPVYSLDGGTTWQPFGNTGLEFTYSSVYPGFTPAHDLTTTQISRDATIPAGSTVRFAVNVQRFLGGGTVNAYCFIRGRLENANGTASPYDHVHIPGDGFAKE